MQPLYNKLNLFSRSDWDGYYREFKKQSLVTRIINTRNSIYLLPLLDKRNFNDIIYGKIIKRESGE
jgi:hypothetical protein